MVGALDMDPGGLDAASLGNATHAAHDDVRCVRERIGRQPAFDGSRRVLDPLLSTGAWPSLDQLSTVAGVRCEADVGPARRRGQLRDRGALYDARITERGELPTRAANWHDLFNVVTWGTFPLTKRALHARQYRRLCERVPARFDRLPGARTPEQSALTQLDEGGLLVWLPPEAPAHTEEALLATLGELATTRIPLANAHLAPHGAQPLLFGHALLEHLALEQRVPRATVMLVRCAPTAVDATLAARLDDDAQPFMCAPVSAWITSSLETGQTPAGANEVRGCSS